MKHFLKSILPILIFFILACAAAAIYLYVELKKIEMPPVVDGGTVNQVSTSTPYVSINGAKVLVEVARTQAERERGLSGRSSLGKNNGLLFVFQSNYFWTIWMKDMNFPIDIIWIDAGGYVVDIVKNAGPDTYPNIVYRPNTPAQYVLEINGGKADEWGIKIGDFAENLFKVAK